MINDLLVNSLAVFLITKILFETAGPFNIFSSVRDYATKKSRNLTVFNSCIWCQVTAFSLLAVVVYLLWGYDLIGLTVLYFATAGVAGILRFFTITKGGK